MGTTDTRTRILAAATALFRQQGFTGTGLSNIERSDARIGSIYHFYPGGKDELVVEAVRTAGPAYAALVLEALDSVDDPVEALRFAFARAADDLAATGYADACPIATIAMEAASTNEAVRAATAEVFEAWVLGFTEWYAARGLGSGIARDLAYATLSALEGAFVLSRATRSGEALLAAGRQMAERLSAALG